MMGKQLYNAAVALAAKSLAIILQTEDTSKERFVLRADVLLLVEAKIGCTLQRTEMVLDSSQIQGTGATGGGAQPGRQPLS
jgi:hypothetical protein